MSDCLEKNMELLKLRYPDIYDGVTRNEIKNFDYDMLDCADNSKTIRFKIGERSILLHSKYNPIKEAELFAKEKMKNQKLINFIYGFGLGYHVLEIQKLLEKDSMLYVFDLNINAFCEALKYNDLSTLINDKRIKLLITGQVGKILKGMEKVLGLGNDTNVMLHVPSVQAIPEEFEDFKFVLEDWNIRKSVSEEYEKVLFENYEANKGILTRNASEFFGRFSGIPAIVVSAGPSLDKNIALIKEVRGKAVVICVGSALNALMSKGIVPDLFCIIDHQQCVMKQIRGYENIGVPGIFLATAAKKVVASYGGPKFIAVHDKTYGKDIKEEELVVPGGSVATACIDIACKMGCNPIILTGQDLAFTNEKSHASGYAHIIHDKKPLKNMRTVKGAAGEELLTTLGYLSYKRWIENRIEDEKDRCFINATEGGAFIRGATHLSLAETMKKYLRQTYDISSIINVIIMGKKE